MVEQISLFSASKHNSSGFSIITYTGTGGTGHTILHGLSQALRLVLIKRTSGT